MLESRGEDGWPFKVFVPGTSAPAFLFAVISKVRDTFHPITLSSTIFTISPHQDSVIITHPATISQFHIVTMWPQVTSPVLPS